MSYLQDMNWFWDDGINLPMINDQIRNEWYKHAMLDHGIEGKTVLDIGFGTGLLSILALDLGARRVIAYEADPGRYKMACSILEELGEDRIELHHHRFYPEDISKHPEVEVIVHELLANNIWSRDGLNVNLGYSIPMIPQHHYVDYFVKPVEEQFAHGLFKEKTNQHLFDPGIDINPRWQHIVNKRIAESCEIDIPQRAPDQHDWSQPVEAPTHIETAWGWNYTQRILCSHQARKVASYSVDSNKNTTFIDDRLGQKQVKLDTTGVDIEIDTAPWKDQLIIIVPKGGARQGDYKMPYEECHWGAMNRPLVLRAGGVVTVRHDFHTGDFIWVVE